MPLPRLRPLDIHPFEHEGKTVFVVRDNEGILEHQLILPPLAFVVACLLDGAENAAQVGDRIEKQFPGSKVPPEEIEAIIRDLDQHCLLESDRVHERRRQITEEYRQASHRPAKFAGLSYAETAVDLGIEIDRYYSGQGGSGAPETSDGADLSAIVAPHIDFPRGGWCYTHAYRQVAERSRADVYVILGVAHVSPENPLIATSKSFETPLGAVPVDRELLAGLEKKFPKCFDDEIVHRSEHSAEFQAVFLRHARRGADFTILPLLCSSFEPHCGEESPSTSARVEEAIQALAETVAACGRKVCLVAGVDFAHVGPRFGDKVTIDGKLIEWMMDEDKKSLEKVAAGDAEGFWQSVLADGNRRHVCGLSATYTMLRLLGPKSGSLLRYGYAPDPAGGIVSFASAVF